MNEPLTAARRLLLISSAAVGRGASVCLLNKSLQALALCMICLLLGACASGEAGCFREAAALACRVALLLTLEQLTHSYTQIQLAETNNYCHFGVRSFDQQKQTTIVSCDRNMNTFSP